MAEGLLLKVYLDGNVVIPKNSYNFYNSYKCHLNPAPGSRKIRGLKYTHTPHTATEKSMGESSPQRL